MARRTLRLEHCDIRFDGLSLDFFEPCDGSQRTLYENLTGKRVNAAIELDPNFSDSLTPCTITVIVKLTNGKTIKRSVTANNEVAHDRVLSVSGLKSIAVECDGDPTGTCSGFLDVELDYCGCCPR